MNKEIAECAGLWLAEGDNKTRSEITFTNNCFDLVLFFHKTMKNIFGDIKPRIYAYSKRNKQVMDLDNIRFRYYTDKRANRTYYIYRIASVSLVKKWKRIVESMFKNERMYQHFLRGFFAGEGNIKTGSHCNRTIRIAQKQQIKIIDMILNYFEIKYTFSKRGRSYVIVNRTNWDRLAKIKIADLHPDKKKKFWKVYSDFKEYHYSHNFIKDNIMNYLNRPKNVRELSVIFGRTLARIQDILIPMKKRGKVINFRVRNVDYWIKTSSNLVVISSVKKRYLDILNKPMTTKQLSDVMNVCWKSSNNRMNELRKLGLVEKDCYLWMKVPINKEVFVI
jgi:hypothetical protein